MHRALHLALSHSKPRLPQQLPHQLPLQHPLLSSCLGSLQLELGLLQPPVLHPQCRYPLVLAKQLLSVLHQALLLHLVVSSHS